MLLSLNKKLLFLAVPKTGSRSVVNLLRPNALSLKTIYDTDHLTYTKCRENVEQNSVDFNMSDIETVYLFYRDPVDRFISAVNYIRTIKNTTNTHLLRKKASWFPGIDYSWYINANGVKPLPEDLLAAVNSMASTITPEQIFADEEIMSMVFFKPQYHWHTDVPPSKLSVLNFSNFEQNVRTLATQFGLAEDVAIPRLNESNKITTSLSPEFEAEIRAYYAADYALGIE